ncbi:hypothetical protein BCR36DRAFT_341981 [Piromyces finnis]|uniref:Sodium/calcium exchanger membrane region domain-containing protein n=1 Tax=Piromyces finnis TaxID=1754191 RepID=A0A1Y1VMA0_9FUNG|nr:hypothetical protein BCR36DRAFT_341981 [Piromyces finnis]|eukprot:ORX59899.1 hypothetical protein BCR36DRAFT_341981 [Piromyces finnis]
MNFISYQRIKHYKNAIFKKQVFYIFIIFSSILAVSILWINKNSEDSNLKIKTDECTIPYTGDKCKYVQTHCSNIKGLFNYLTFIYCTMENYSVLSLIIMVIWVVWIFLLFGTSSSSFFSPNLTVIANSLRLPESVAGVTLAALGNGAPDVFGTFSSFKANSGGLAIGELVGASLFVTILVIGSISLVSPLKVSKKPFLCDILFFIGAVICVLIIIIKGHISSTDSIIMLSYYILYVILVVVSNWSKHSKQSRIDSYHSLGLHFPRCDFDSDSEELYSESDINSCLSESFSSSLASSLSSDFNDDKSTSIRNNRPLIITNSRETDNNEIILSPPSFSLSINITQEDKIRNDNESNEEVNYNENTPLLNKLDSNDNEIKNYLSNHTNTNHNAFKSDTISTPNAIKNTLSFKDQFIFTFFPYLKDWQHQSFITKCINLFCLPFNLALALTIPVITPDIQNAYKQQVKKVNENVESNRHQHQHHYHHFYKQENTNDLNEIQFQTSSERELKRIEQKKKQQLSRILSESKLKNASLSRSTSFEEIDSLVRKGLTKKHLQYSQSKLSKSYTHDNLFMANSEEPQIHPLKKSQSLNQIIMKKKYKGCTYDPESRKALLNTSLMNSQKLKERVNQASNKMPSFSNQSTVSQLKFENYSAGMAPTYDSIPVEHANHSTLLHGSQNEIDSNKNHRNNQITKEANKNLFSTSLSSINTNSTNSIGNNGQVSTSSYLIRNNSINRVMSVSSINNYDFSDINENNSFFMETNNISLSPSNSENKSYKSYGDFNSKYGNNTLSEDSIYDGFSFHEPLINHDTSINTNVRGSSKENSNHHHGSLDHQINLSEVWNKWLIVISTTVCPLFIMLILSIDLDIKYYHWICSCILSFIAFLLTTLCIKNDQIPSYYCIFSIIGFISGISWIYIIANEVVAVLQSLGKIFHISDAIMGLSLFAMGNSLGDLITNVSIAKMGFSKMALGACLGTPLLNIILGLGLSGCILTEKKHKSLLIKIDSNTLYFSVIGLLISTIGTLFFVYFNNFRMTRSYGLCAIILYALIVIIQVIIEITYK